MRLKGPHEKTLSMRVKHYLLEKIKKQGAIHLTLLDPDKLTPSEFRDLALYAQESGSDALMIGGSLGVTEAQLDEYLSKVKEKLRIPVILFPGSIACLSKYADAVFFLSVLNSLNTYYIIEAQVQASMLLLKHFKNLEVISLAYIIVGDGGTVGFVSNAKPIPYEKYDIAVAYAYTAQLIGFDMIYLEAGSGAREHVRPEMVARIKAIVEKPLIVGGGIRSPESAKALVKAGADAIVTGTIIERDPQSYREIVRAVHESGKEKVKAGVTSEEAI